MSSTATIAKIAIAMRKDPCALKILLTVPAASSATIRFCNIEKLAIGANIAMRINPIPATIAELRSEIPSAFQFDCEFMVFALVGIHRK